MPIASKLGAGFALTLAAFGLAACTTAEPTAPADAVFLNGKVFTAEEDGGVAEAFALRGERFVAVGSNAEIRRLAGPGTQIVDLGGRFVSPGLADAHFHSEGGGPNVDLSRVKTMSELLGAIREAASRARPGELIMTNADWHEMQLAEKRLPVATELDTAAPGNPLVVVRGGHSLILNSAALRKWNITKETVSPEGGQITKDERGELTGELFDNAKSLIQLPPPPPVTIEDARTTQRVLNSHGITSARIIGGYKTDSPTAWKLFSQLKDAGELTVRYNVFLSGFGRGGSADASPAERAAAVVKGVEASGLRQGQGDEWIRLGGVKLGVDGGFEGGLMLHPYAEPYGRGGTYYGLRTVPVPVFNEIVRQLNQRGWIIATHAAGDAAVGMVLDAYRLAHREKAIDDKRWAIEHAFLATPQQVQAAKELGIVMSVQDHLFVAGPAFRKYLGVSRANRITPLRTYMDAGLPVALGTDSPVIPVNPYWELYHYVSRDTRSDGVYGPEERLLDRKRLLRAMTAGYAYLTHEEGIKGTISPGKLADFVVMSDDFLTVPADKVRGMTALATYVGGKQVHRSADWR
jgi:predicted amidohydrolase YtcJ